MSTRCTTGSALTLTMLLFAGGANAATPAYQALVAGDSPLVYYKLNEPSGDVINYGTLGASMNAQRLTLGATPPTPGAPTASGDTGVSFDALQSQYIESNAAVPVSLTGNPTFSCETVVRVGALNTDVGYPPFAYWGDNGTGKSVYFSVQHVNARRVYAGFYNAGVRGKYDSPINRWAHVVMTRQGGGTASTGTKIYVNGKEIATEPDAVLCCNAATPNVTQTPLRIERANDFTRYFTGTVDEVAVYDKVLTAQQIKARFDALNLPPCAGDIADVAGANGSGPDGLLSAADIVAFFDGFFSAAGCPGTPPCNLADVADVSGAPKPDGQLTASDVVTFITSFFAGCG